VPEHLFETLAEDADFATTWALAKLIAQRTADGARADIAAAGASLSARGCNLGNALTLANIIRGRATFRYCTAKSVGDPLALQRAVRRLLGVTV
jgi:hypothetical protein